MEQRKNFKSSGEFKQMARQQLKGKWGKAALVVFIYSAILFIFNLIPFFGAIGRFVIGGALLLGLTTYFLKLAREEELKIDNLFSGFENFGSSFLVHLLMGIFTALWSLIAIIPAIILFFVMFGSEFSLYSSHSNTGIKVLVFFIILGVLLIPTIVAVYRYSMAYYLLSDHPNIGAYEAIVESKKMMDGNKLNLFYLQLTFLALNILCALPLVAVEYYARINNVTGITSEGVILLWKVIAYIIIMIASLFITPYMHTATANFYIELKNDKQE